MSNLKDLSLKFKYRSDSDKLYLDFYQPCIENSIKYDRAVGYFTSNSLKLLSKGLEKFVYSGGKIRIITNPYLTNEDIEAINLGKIAKKDLVIRKIIETLEISEKSIEDNTLNILAWLIYKDILEIKIAYTMENSIYHEKFGLFYDENGNRVMFSGSSNETFGGMSSNFEKIDVFYTENDKERIIDAENDFYNLWSNKTNGLEIIEFPEDAKERILLNRKDSIKGSVKNDEEKNKPRDYQTDAINALKDNDYIGIFEMATGTGKTKTSLFSAERYFNEKGKVFLVILVPYIHLVDQWANECRKFDFDNIVTCFGDKKTWTYKAHDLIKSYNENNTQKAVLIAVYKTSASDVFMKLVNKVLSNTFLIADECHYFGSKNMQLVDFSNMNARLGLSATPSRWWDDQGTNYIYNYFKKTVFSYTIEEAIQKRALTNYQYFPILVGLNYDELYEYDELTLKIVRLLNSDKEEDIKKAERLIIRRKQIINLAEDKKIELKKILSKMDIENEKHILVYCAPTEIIDVTNIIHDLGYSVSKFDSTINAIDRQILLDKFDKAEIQILVAIRCLDEGVDIPSTKTAFFLASTSNPKQFIQRRGRVLRPAKNKNMAYIYDFVVTYNDNKELYLDLLKKELPRFAEFADNAINKYIARDELWSIMKRYNLEYLLDKKSWDLYKELNMKEEISNGD